MREGEQQAPVLRASAHARSAGEFPREARPHLVRRVGDGLTGFGGAVVAAGAVTREGLLETPRKCREGMTSIGARAVQRARGLPGGDRDGRPLSDDRIPGGAGSRRPGLESSGERRLGKSCPKKQGRGERGHRQNARPRCCCGFGRRVQEAGRTGLPGKPQQEIDGRSLPEGGGRRFRPVERSRRSESVGNFTTVGEWAKFHRVPVVNVVRMWSIDPAQQS